MAEVLFVCVHNAGRSQMAEVLFNKEAKGRGLPFRATSAGTMPGARVHREVAFVMREVDIALSMARPKLLTDDMAAGATRVITMGCQVDAEACPVLFLKGVEDWGLPDPSGRSLLEVREIRDEIAARVGRLLDELATESGPAPASGYLRSGWHGTRRTGWMACPA